MPGDAPFQRSAYVLRSSAGGLETALASATQADAEALGPAIAGMDPWARLGGSPAQLISSLAGSNEIRRCYAIWHGGVRAGAVVVRFPWLSGPYLNLLAVLPAYQRTGVGRAALAWMEVEARAAGARNCFLCVSGFNTAAQGFYRRNGYSDAVLLDDLLKDGEDEILMRKQLR